MTDVRGKKHPDTDTYELKSPKQVLPYPVSFIQKMDKSLQ